MIQALGKSGSAVAVDAPALTKVFADLAERTNQLQKRFYSLGYCSPKLKGNHVLTIELAAIDKQDSVGVTLVADSFDVSGTTCGAAAMRTYPWGEAWPNCSYDGLACCRRQLRELCEPACEQRCVADA